MEEPCYASSFGDSPATNASTVSPPGAVDSSRDDLTNSPFRPSAIRIAFDRDRSSSGGTPSPLAQSSLSSAAAAAAATAAATAAAAATPTAAVATPASATASASKSSSSGGNFFGAYAAEPSSGGSDSAKPSRGSSSRSSSNSNQPRHRAAVPPAVDTDFTTTAAAAAGGSSGASMSTPTHPGMATAGGGGHDNNSNAAENAAAPVDAARGGDGDLSSDWYQKTFGNEISLVESALTPDSPGGSRPSGARGSDELRQIAQLQRTLFEREAEAVRLQEEKQAKEAEVRALNARLTRLSMACDGLAQAAGRGLHSEAARVQTGVTAWDPDDQYDDCWMCGRTFNFTRRKHHCRMCGHIFCARCAPNSCRRPIPQKNFHKPVRHCLQCWGHVPEALRLDELQRQIEILQARMVAKPSRGLVGQTMECYMESMELAHSISEVQHKAVQRRMQRFLATAEVRAVLSLPEDATEADAAAAAHSLRASMHAEEAAGSGGQGGGAGGGGSVAMAADAALEALESELQKQEQLVAAAAAAAPPPVSATAGGDGAAKSDADLWVAGQSTFGRV